ncbi:MAG: LemA family protein [Chitinophagaceae bacterium]|uniref:LemA family protein n=1 Tax=Rurimicrobium arvi TaxID=2049916 RepID=A0ABP8MT78_9BACT
MKKALPVLLVLLAVIFIGGCMSCNIQRNLVTLDEDVKAKWSQVQNQYQRRSDLIGNLVETVKGAANFEKSTLTAVIEARAKATSIKVDPNDLSPEKLKEFQSAQGELSQALGRLMVVNEAYPELKTNENFLKLQDEIAGTENRIAVERKNYNESVQAYNVETRKFPNNLFAGMMGFKVRGTFEADAAAQSAPKVKF